MFRKFPETDPNDKNIDPDDPDSRPLLHLLIESEYDELIDFFLFKCPIKADPNLIDDKTEITPLCSAVAEGYLNIVKMLIKAGANVDLPCDNMTPCEWAACQGHLEILEYLARDGKAKLSANGDSLNIYGSVLHLACFSNQPHIVEYLLLETNAYDKEYDPIDFCTSKLNYGCLNVFHICARQGTVECFKLILNFLQQVGIVGPILKQILNFKNKQGNTPLHEAYEHKKYDMAQEFIATGEMDF